MSGISVGGTRKIFISAVTSEFASYRQKLAEALKRPALEIKIQEDFGVVGTSTLLKLNDYIRTCDAVVHLIGKASGARPAPPAVQQLLTQCPNFADRVSSLSRILAGPTPDLSFTQWEAYLALYHSRPVYVYLPTDFDAPTPNCVRGPTFVHSFSQEEDQRIHLGRIRELGHDRGTFADPTHLLSAVERDLADILPRLQTPLDQKASGGPGPLGGVGPVPHPTVDHAYALQPVACPSQPFDLGYSLGLPRTGFVAVVADGLDRPLIPTLYSAERVLIDAAKVAAASDFPLRWWFQVDPSNCPNGPADADAVLNSLYGADTKTRCAYLKEFGVPAGGVLGFIMATSESNPVPRATLMAWAESLLRIFSESSALIIHVRSPVRSAARKAALEIAGSQPLRDRHPQVFLRSPPTESRTDFKRFNVHRSPEDVLTKWVGTALTGAGLAEQEAVALEFSTLAGYVDARSTDRLDPPKAVLDALAKLSVVHPTLLDDALALFLDRLPDSMAALLAEAARCPHASVRRSALRAAQSSDGLMDVLVAHISDATLWMPGACTFSKEDGKRPVVDDFALALVRRVRDSLTHQLEPLIESLRPLVSFPVERMLAEALRSGGPADWSEIPAASWCDLGRSQLPVGDLGVLLSDPEYFQSWWCLSTRAPERTAVEAILRCDWETRAIPRLLFTHEADAAQVSEELVERIRVCRRTPAVVPRPRL